jgi:hypothetical protein
MNLPMIWFVPLGALLGLAGTRTASQLRKLRGHGHPAEVAALISMAWFPLLVWAIVAFSGITE